MTGRGTRVPLLGRLETRVIAALALLGILCVGASAYLVQLTVSFFQARTTAALVQGGEVVDAVTPFYRDLVQSHVAAFEARGRAMALELALVADRDDPRTARIVLEDMRASEPDVLQLALLRAGETDRITVGSAAGGLDRTYVTEHEVVVRDARDGGGPAVLEVVFAIDPEPTARFQALGQRKRAIAQQQSQQEELERAVFKAVGIASALVLAIAFVVGFALARSLTRKVGDLSVAMRRVGGGDLTARAPAGGSDELGQLGAAFNHMLDELVAAQRKLAYLERIGAWQEMARRLAHEIKNPLTPIQLAVQELKNKDPGISPEFSRLLRTSADIVQDEIDGLRRMVASFSQFAKVPEVRAEPVSVARIVNEFERAYGHLTERDVDVLEIRPPTPDVLILGDRQLLKQVLVNLVENAVLSKRERDADPVRVSITARVEEAHVLVVVEDNGPGIAFDRRDLVFEPYETSRDHGTGLGLAIVKKIILDHGGEVWVGDSALGGAAFWVRLPVHASSE